MGGWPYQYVVPFQSDAQAALDALRADECDALWEDLERGQARYVVTYDRDVPANLVFVGYSFD